MKGLDFLLSEESERVESKTQTKTAGDKLNDLQITQYAVDRAFTYAKLVCEVTQAENECIGYLISPKDSRDRIVKDVYFPKEQEVTSSFVEISPQQVIVAGRDIDAMGYRVLGWWHSHAGFNTFHSGTDERNQLTVLNAIAPINYITRVNEKAIANGNLEVKIEDGKVTISEKNNRGIKYELSVDQASGLAIAGMKIIEEERVGFAYSLVVHNTAKPKSFFGSSYKTETTVPSTEIAKTSSPLLLPASTLEVSPFEEMVTSGFSKVERLFTPSYTPTRQMSEEEMEIRKGLETRERHPYAEIATRTFCTGCKDIKDISKKVGLNVSPETRELDENVMRKEVEERVVKRRLFSFPGFGGYKHYKGSSKHGYYGQESQEDFAVDPNQDEIVSRYEFGVPGQSAGNFTPKPRKIKKHNKVVKVIPANKKPVIEIITDGEK